MAKRVTHISLDTLTTLCKRTIDTGAFDNRFLNAVPVENAQEATCKTCLAKHATHIVETQSDDTNPFICNYCLTNGITHVFQHDLGHAYCDNCTCAHVAVQPPPQKDAYVATFTEENRIPYAQTNGILLHLQIAEETLCQSDTANAALFPFHSNLSPKDLIDTFATYEGVFCATCVDIFHDKVFLGIFYTDALVTYARKLLRSRTNTARRRLLRNRDAFASYVEQQGHMSARDFKEEVRLTMEMIANF